jgi:hypothetical protein
VSAGRNDPCPCGSGAKYKRCCLERELELERLTQELEGIVDELARVAWTDHPDWCAARFAELYEGGVGAFGLGGPDPSELLEAHLWFLLDCPFDAGDTPLERLRLTRTGRALELLERSELRAWRVASVDGAGVFDALCPLGTGRARLETIRPPEGELRPGAFVVARSVPLGPQRWALLGSVPVIPGEIAADFDALLASLEAPPGQFWRVHGGVLARAAWTWPERRTHTIEGEIVTDALVAFELREPHKAIAALTLDPELDGGEPMYGEAWVLRWLWRWDPPAAQAPPVERGVRYDLCSEDADPQPALALVEVDVDYGELWLFAPTPARLALAEQLLLGRLGDMVGEVRTRDLECPDMTPRWQRLRWDRTLERIEPSLRRRRRKSAA